MKIGKLFSFFRDVKNETKRITWPKKQEVIATLIVVLVLATIAAIFLYGIDALCIYIINKIV